MAKLIQIEDGCWVDAALVWRIQCVALIPGKTYSHRVSVELRPVNEGRSTFSIVVPCDSDRMARETADRIARMVNTALAESP